MNRKKTAEVVHPTDCSLKLSSLSFRNNSLQATLNRASIAI
jgi:hypothetical protein